MADKIVVGGEVQGNVTSCEPKEFTAKVDRNSAWSWTEKRTVRVINQCTQETLSEYEYSVFTGVPLFYLIVIPTVLFVLVIIGGGH